MAKANDHITSKDTLQGIVLQTGKASADTIRVLTHGLDTWVLVLVNGNCFYGVAVLCELCAVYVCEQASFLLECFTAHLQDQSCWGYYTAAYSSHSTANDGNSDAAAVARSIKAFRTPRNAAPLM